MCSHDSCMTELQTSILIGLHSPVFPEGAAQSDFSKLEYSLPRLCAATFFKETWQLFKIRREIKVETLGCPHVPSNILDSRVDQTN